MGTPKYDNTAVTDLGPKLIKKDFVEKEGRRGGGGGGLSLPEVGSQ